MSNGLEILKAAIDDFEEIQEYMFLAKKENAAGTYERLKKKYFSLKAILNVGDVNLAHIDRIKE